MMRRNGIAGKKVLLVLDAAASHGQVRPLLPGSPGSLVLITSRRRLAALEEATPISLGMLSPDEAAELFGRLTSRTAREPEAVAEITRLCGYLPLAIRLIAGTLRRHPSWTVADLAATKDRLAAMRAENLSVAAAFDLSYEPLSPGQRRLFRRLAFTPHPPPGRTRSASSSGSPARSARATTGTSPPCDTRFGSSNTALVRARVCDDRTCQVSSWHRRWERRELRSSQFRGHLSHCRARNIP
jgi:NB-ARC domain